MLLTTTSADFKTNPKDCVFKIVFWLCFKFLRAKLLCLSEGKSLCFITALSYSLFELLFAFLKSLISRYSYKLCDTIAVKCSEEEIHALYETIFCLKNFLFFPLFLFSAYPAFIIFYNFMLILCVFSTFHSCLSSFCFQHM